MKPAAVLLIDLENFVLSRFDHFNDENIRVEDRPSFAEDLKNLVRYALRMAGLPFAVRRAYADFDSLTVNPQELMRQGVEPVQVFRLSGKSANKNAADMKLAMDAISLAGSNPQFEHFVLISGDADFIPVILELKKRGHTVSVIAVTGATNDLIQRFVDNFELFEDLVAAETVKTRGRVAAPDELPRVAGAVRRVLSRARPVRFGQVQPLLSKELGYAFDAGAFGCDSTGEFLRKHASALGIVVRGSHNEQEIDLPNVPVPSTNGHGTNGSKPGVRQPSRPVGVAERPAQPAFEPHSPAHYKYLLASGRTDANEARVLVVPWSSLVWVCDAVVPALTPPTGGPATSIELMPRLQEAARATGTPDLAAHVSLIHSAVRSALPVPSPDGVYALSPDTTGERLRRRLLRYVVYVLGCRMAENGVTGPIRVESLVALFDPGPALEQALAEVTAALADAAAEPEPVAPTAPSPSIAVPKPGSRADDIHTGSGYRKLFQCGGPKDSGENEHTRINPPPWPSIERVCIDAFAALSPTVGGAGVLPRGLFWERLYAADFVDGYRSHVRRAFTLLKISHAILEEDDRVTLHPEVTEPGDIRWAVLGVMLKLIELRLHEKKIDGPIRADAFVAAIEAGPHTDELLSQIARVVEGMYQAATEEPDAATVDVAPEPVSGAAVAESAPTEPQAEVQLEIVADIADDSVPVVEPEPATVEPTRLEVVAIETSQPVTSESAEWDPFAFDGTLPEYATPVPHLTTPAIAEQPPTPPPVLEQPPEPFPTPVETPSSDAIDIAALTSEAIVSAVEPAPVRVVEAPVAAEPPPTLQPEPEPEAPVLEPPVEVGSAETALAPVPKPLSVDDEFPLALPLADWVQDDDALFIEPEVGAERITERLTGSSARLAPQPRPPAEEDPDEVSIFADPEMVAERITERLTGSSTRLPRTADTFLPVARIAPPPLPPSVVPPPPPESA